MRRLRMILEMIRFSHTVFALPFALLSAVMAWRLNAADDPPRSWRVAELAGIVLCMVFARSAAMAFNRLADRKFDAENPRTRSRHIPAGLLSVGSVTLFAIFCAAAFVASTLLFLPNRLPIYLSLPVLAFLLAYSYTKRFTSLAHFWLGAALMMAPVAAWIAVRGEVALAPTVLGAAVLLWVAGFDVIYACQDVDYDRQCGLRSVPVRLGVANSLRLASICHLGTIALLFALPLVYPLLDGIYLLGIAAVSLLLIYEHWIVRPDDLTRVNVAFFNVNAVISVGLFVIGSLDLLI
ncbi:MAG TPA: UbiA-like polyprenyltransferase [Pirellulales bacterium]|jgi:4-hydroxybenzoate polyprenyltransferase